MMISSRSETAIWLTQEIKQVNGGAADGFGLATQSAGIGRFYFER